jgi:hypothetical protein
MSHQAAHAHHKRAGAAQLVKKIAKDFHLTKDFRQIRGKSFVIMVCTRRAERIFLAYPAFGRRDAGETPERRRDAGETPERRRDAGETPERRRDADAATQWQRPSAYAGPASPGEAWPRQGSRGG